MTSSWIPTSGSSRPTYVQKYGFMERLFMRFVADEGAPAQFTMLGSVPFRVAPHLSLPDLEARLRQTWRAMRYYSPGLATLSRPEGRTYHVPDARELKEWEDGTFVMHKAGSGMTGDKLVRSVKREAMTTLHFLPDAMGKEAHELVLQAEHQNLDGRGILYFFDRFWKVFVDSAQREDIKFGDEWKRLPKQLDELLGLSATPSDEEKQIAMDWLAPLGEMAPVAVPVLPSRRERDPTYSLRSNLRLTREETSAVIAACKSRGLTVTSAWLAAVTLALGQSQVAATGAKLSPNAGLATFTTVDMRKYFPATAEFNPREGHFACYHGTLPVTLNIGQGASFDHLAGKMRRGLHEEGVTEEWARAWAPMTDMGGDAVMEHDQRESMPLTTSLGVLELFMNHRYEGTEDGGCVVEIQDLWIADTMMSGTNMWMMHTWDGQITLSSTYNEAYFEEGQILAVLEQIREGLLKGLDSQ